MARQILDSIVKRAQADDDLIAVILFGSMARGEAAPRDLDICLVTRQDFPRERLGKKRLAYLGHHDADIQVFQALPLPVRSRVLKEGRVLLAKDEDALYDLANQTIRSYTYFRRPYMLYLEGVRSGR